jgi:hypothetical protein
MTMCKTQWFISWISELQGLLGKQPLVNEKKIILYKLVTCELHHVLASSLNSSLFLKHCDLNQFFRWVNRWSNNSQLKCSSNARVQAAEYRLALSWSITPCLLFWMTLRSFFLVFCSGVVTLLLSLVAWIPPSALLSCPVSENRCN